MREEVCIDNLYQKAIFSISQNEFLITLFIFIKILLEIIVLNYWLNKNYSFPVPFRSDPIAESGCNPILLRWLFRLNQNRNNHHYCVSIPLHSWILFPAPTLQPTVAWFIYIHVIILHLIYTFHCFYLSFCLHLIEIWLKIRNLKN